MDTTQYRGDQDELCGINLNDLKAKRRKKKLLKARVRKK
jgi:hypothetical protein